MKDNFSNQKGSVLLYTLLVVSAVLTTTLVISNFLRNSIKETGTMNNVAAAHYAAESGIEKTLFVIRKTDKLPISGDCGLPNAKCTVEVAEQAVSELKLDLAVNQTVQFDLAKTDIKFGAGVESIGLSWDAGISRLEVTGVDLAGSGVISVPKAGETTVLKNLFGGGFASANMFSASKNYRVRVKALYGDAKNLKIKLFSLDNQLGKQLPFSNFLKIKTEGSAGEANQNVSVDMSRYSPVQGIFDYVLFSEDALVK